MKDFLESDDVKLVLDGALTLILDLEIATKGEIGNKMSIMKRFRVALINIRDKAYTDGFNDGQKVGWDEAYNDYLASKDD